MTSLFAVSFNSDLSLEQLFARLNEAGPWRWLMRDSEHWGDYISARALPLPLQAMVKIYVEPDHYVVNVSFDSEGADAPAELAALRETLFDRLLPAIGARNIAPTDTYD